ncbi:MAG: amino acid adenylation domain-containing protein, partial [Acidobacteriia bacterium]|nr:amino acid adenylation domain-containing protein [Terriglobia bacterium]
PIGQPIANTQLYVLDDAMELVPVGGKGELYIGGVGVARGYLDRPELTAERFVPDPFNGSNGERLYRTGDLTRWRADGNLEFMGRADEQIKIRGYRIELGEIETTLGEHPAVNQAVVLARKRKSGETILAAYVVPSRKVSTIELREALKQRLPSYMVPALFIMLDALPLTPSAKIDRHALLALPLAVDEILQESHAAPRTQVEELVAQVWGQVLDLKQVGVDQDFFAIGGHSLLATRVVSRIRQALGVELPVRSLFESPTVAALAARIEEAKWMGARPTLTHIDHVKRDEPLPLSFAQQRLWFLEQLQPGDTSYNIPGAVRIEGTLDAQILERSFGEIVRRHESLRTRFEAVQGEPRQIIENAGRLKLEQVDLSGLAGEELEREIERQAREEAQRAFDLTRCPLLRTVLLKCSEQDHVLVLTMHHIVSDGWSLGILLREIAVLYESYLAGQPSPLGELEVQYADFSVWQRQWMTGEVLEQQLGYWRKQLGGAPPGLELPTDRPRPAVAGIEGAHEPVRLERELVDGLKALAQAKGATLYMVLLAGFQTLLYRYSGQKEIFVGSPVAGRTRSELEGLIGFAHQDVPFEKLVEELAPQRDLGSTPLFQVMFALQNVPFPELELGQARLRSLDFESGTAKFDWTLFLDETNGELFGSLEYKTELFDASTIQRMLRHYRSILAAIVSEPEATLDLIPLLDEAERRQLAVEWNDTAHTWSGTRWIHEMFEDRAVAAPAALAVEFGPERLSYSELNKRANQLAHYLRKMGVGPEVRVAVCMERNLELVISLMAVVKAGGAYVPVDPDYPAERIAFMLEDAEAPVILSQANCARAVASATGKVVVVDAEWPRISKESAGNPGIAMDPENLVYVIYTSGSTGRPKGAMNVHKGLRNRLLWMQHMYGLDESDRVLQKTPFSFDVSVWEFFWPLAVGAGLVVARPGGHQDPEYLGETIQKCSVTTLHFVPSMLKVFLESGAVEHCGSLRRIICSGEALGPDVAKKCLEQVPAELHNLYGPTEASIDVTYWHCQPSDNGVPIGRPISNIQTYVLDEQMNLSPTGVAGELYLGGVGLARGYWHRSELTAEKFVPDPLSSEAGSRLYRTGDWARWRPNGSLEYIGRRDEQVKLRGNRIELGEIETALRQHPKIKDAAVVLNQDAAGEKRLAAYLVSNEGQIPSQAHLRKYLAEKMPEYMVPAVYIQLAELPLSPNGKLDRRRLPAISAEHILAENVYVAPTSPIEELLARIWEDVLGLKKIGAQANFFALGGHSLLVTRVTARIRDVFKVDVPLRRLFESPTIASLSQVIEAAMQAKKSGEEHATPVPELEQVARRGYLPLSFAQQRLWFLNQLTPGDTSYNVPGAVQIEGPLDVNALEKSLQEIMQRHEVLRTAFIEIEGEPRQVVEDSLQLQLKHISLISVAAEQREAEVLRLAEEEAQQPFDLGHAPMFRASLLRCGEENHVLLLTLHHIASDGWSLGILVRELSTYYEAFANGRPCLMPSLPIQYADFSVWQRKWLSGAILENQVAYWKQQLQGAPPALELPTDRPRPPVQTTNGAQLDASLGADVAAALKVFAREQGVTVFMTLLAAFQSLLYRYTGQDDILVGTPIAGRTRIETEGLIGCFVNTLVMKTEFADDVSFAGLMPQIKETTLEAYAHQDLPFEKLVDELAPQRDLSRSPLFQVMFALQNLPSSELRLGEARLRIMELGTRQANFELELVQSEVDSGRIQGHLEYNTDLFESSTIDRMLGHYRVLLQALLTKPAQPISMLPLLAEQERQ